MIPGDGLVTESDIPEVPERGVAVNLYYRQVSSGVRPFVFSDDSVWCEGLCEWWPFMASAVGLFTLRVKYSDRALCRAAE